MKPMGTAKGQKMSPTMKWSRTLTAIAGELE